MLVADGLILDPGAVEVTLDGEPVSITPAEFRILHALMRRPGRVFSRDELIDALHRDHDPGIIDRTIDVHLGRLRRKLGDDAAAPRFIGTVRTRGLQVRGARRTPGRAMTSLRTRLVVVFVGLALVVAGVIVFAVMQFSAEQIMHLIMEGVDYAGGGAGHVRPVRPAASCSSAPPSACSSAAWPPGGWCVVCCVRSSG